MPSVQDIVTVIEERAIRSRIKQARKEAGLTQEQIADLIGVDDRTYQNYERENEKGRTPWRMMNAISAATGKSQEWLLHGEDSESRATTEADLNALSSQITSEVKALLLPIGERLFAIEEQLTSLEQAERVRQARDRRKGRRQGTGAHDKGQASDS